MNDIRGKFDELVSLIRETFPRRKKGMNYCEYANRRMYSEWRNGARPSLAVGEKKGAYDDSITVDLDGADFNESIETADIPIGLSHVRMGEVLEHLVHDADALWNVRESLRDDGQLLVTVPFNGEAEYHVRLHNDWSIRQLLRSCGFCVVSYVPRKAQRIDRLIWLLRGMFGQWVNGMFFRINPYLPWRPNGGYYLCEKCVPEDIEQINRRVFR